MYHPSLQKRKKVEKDDHSNFLLLGTERERRLKRFNLRFLGKKKTQPLSERKKQEHPIISVAIIHREKRGKQFFFGPATKVSLTNVD